MCCACFGPRLSSYYDYYFCAPDIVAAGNILNFFIYDAVLSQDSNSSSSLQRADTLLDMPQLRVIKFIVFTIMNVFFFMCHVPIPPSKVAYLLPLTISLMLILLVKQYFVKRSFFTFMFSHFIR